MLRQGMTITINQLKTILKDLKKKSEKIEHQTGMPPDENRKWMIAIINKSEKESDTWELEEVE